MKVLVVIFLACSALTYNANASASISDWFVGLFSGPAVDYGSWHCNGCQIMAPGQDHNAQILGQVAEYIRTNNKDIHATKNEMVDRWNENSRITICEASVCMDFYFNGLPLSRWAPRYPSRPQRANENPRVPTNPSPQSAAQPPILMISVSILGPTYYDMAITMPGEIAIERNRHASVTVIEHAHSNTYVGPSVFMPYSFNSSIGQFLGWSPVWTLGLQPTGGGGGVCEPLCYYANGAVRVD